MSERAAGALASNRPTCDQASGSRSSRTNTAGRIGSSGLAKLAAAEPISSPSR
jgi:hypothetical protein